MYHNFDNNGWYTGSTEAAGSRCTDIEPENKSLTQVPGELRANFTGYEWVDSAFSLPSQESLLAAVDQFLQDGAALKRYDSIHTAALRAGYPGPFHDEGVSYATWMDTVYATCYSLLAQVEAGTLQYPSSTSALVAMLPPCPFAPNSSGS